MTAESANQSGKPSLGELEQLVILALLRLGGEAYAVPILEEIEARTGRVVGHASAYVALRRLEKRGFVVSRLGEPTRERGGRSRRYFRILPEAVRSVTRSREAMAAMWDGLEPEMG